MCFWFEKIDYVWYNKAIIKIFVVSAKHRTKSEREWGMSWQILIRIGGKYYLKWAINGINKELLNYASQIFGQENMANMNRNILNLLRQSKSLPRMLNKNKRERIILWLIHIK